jgi:alkylhydroperoxidase/carboxymuconolactone decarboxylase family protein YurZ
MDDEGFGSRQRVLAGWNRSMALPEPPPGEAGSFSEFAQAVAFGELWNRGRFTVRERRLVILTVLALFGHDRVTRLHLSSALELGDLGPEDVEELLVTLATYAGMPVATAFQMVAQQVLADQDER